MWWENVALTRTTRKVSWKSLIWCGCYSIHTCVIVCQEVLTFIKKTHCICSNFGCWLVFGRTKILFSKLTRDVSASWLFFVCLNLCIIRAEWQRNFVCSRLLWFLYSALRKEIMEDVLLHAAGSARYVPSQGRARISQESGEQQQTSARVQINLRFSLPRSHSSRIMFITQ